MSEFEDGVRAERTSDEGARRDGPDCLDADAAVSLVALLGEEPARRLAHLGGCDVCCARIASARAVTAGLAELPVRRGFVDHVMAEVTASTEPLVSRLAWGALNAALTFGAAAFAVRAVGVGAGPPVLAVVGALAGALAMGLSVSRRRATDLRTAGGA